MPIGRPKKKRRKDRNQRNMKNLTWKNCGPQKKLAVARRGTSRRGKVTRHTKETDKMSRHATVAQRVSDIFRHNTTCRGTVARPRKDICRPNMTHRSKVTQPKKRRFQSSQEGPPVEQGRRKNRTKNHSTRGPQNGWTPKWRQLMCQEGTKETRNRDFEDQLRLGSK
jgi:hypothetical protein